MTSDEKIVKLLEMQEQGGSVEEICKALGLSSSGALSNLANRKGYRFDKGLKKYVEKNNTGIPIDKEGKKEEKNKSNIESNTMRNTRNDSAESQSGKRCNTKSNTKSNTNNNTDKKEGVIPVLPSDLLSLWDNEKETIEDIIRWYKKLKEDKKTDIFIDLPKSTNTMVSTRSNKEIWERFGEFSEKHKKDFSKGDLLAQAIKEFIRKYS